MRKPLKKIRLAVVFAAGLTVLSSAMTTAQSEDFLSSPIPSSTPAGITLVEVHRVEEYSSDQYFFTRLGDIDGKTLFYPSSNSNATSTNFYPVLAANDAAAFDDWTLEHCNIGARERRNIHDWNIGTLQHWNIGTLQHWNIATLERCNIGTLQN